MVADNCGIAHRNVLDSQPKERIMRLSDRRIREEIIVDRETARSPSSPRRAIEGTMVKIGIEATPEVKVLREELGEPTEAG